MLNLLLCTVSHLIERMDCVSPLCHHKGSHRNCSLIFDDGEKEAAWHNSASRCEAAAQPTRYGRLAKVDRKKVKADSETYTEIV